MDTLLRDVRVALRTLRKSPGFTLIAILCVALGTGATTAIFSVVDTVLLRPLPYAQPDRLVRLFETFHNGGGYGSVSTANFLDWRRQTHAFQQLAAYSTINVNLQGSEQPERLSGVASTANLFTLLGDAPLLGRTFLPGEDQPGAPDVVVLSEQLWRQRFGADPSIIGRTITLNGDAATVIGVMPTAFHFPSRSSTVDVWVPLRFTPQQTANRGSHWLAVVGRLAPGATLATALDEMRGIARHLAEQYPDEQADRSVRLDPLRDVMVGTARPALLVLLGAAALVLLIACANVANLLLARAAGRRREVAIRSALGARRTRLLRQFLTESLLLSLVGAAVGLLIAHWGVRLLAVLAAHAVPQAGSVHFDATVFVFLLVVALATGVGFGLVPALQATRTDLRDDLTDGGRQGSAGRGQRGLRGALIVGEFALALMLVVGAGLLLKTFFALQSTDPGLVAHNVLTLHVSLPDEQYGTPAAAQQFYHTALERISALPGVRAAGIVQCMPIQCQGYNGDFAIAGRPPARTGQAPFAEFRMVSPDFFRTLGIPIVKGRGLSAEDNATSRPVVVINQALAHRYFADQSPIGQRLKGIDTSWATIVGVVGNVRQWGLDAASHPALYAPYEQVPFAGALDDMAIVISTAVTPTTLTAPVRAAIQSVDPNQPIYAVQTMERVIAQSVSDRRLNLWLLGTFAALALVLAAAGIYGVMSYLVTQRTREIGIRVALGASTGNVLRIIVRQGMMLAVSGIVIGVVGGLLLTRVLASLLYGVSATDPFTFAFVALVLAAVALLATYLPARRAAGIDPIIAMKAE